MPTTTAPGTGVRDAEGRPITDRPETFPGALDALNLLDTAVEALGGQRRDGQRFMAAKVAEALDTGRHLLVQAGTGTGKSLAYLTPALHHAAGRRGAGAGPVVVATATLALQSQVVGRDVPRLLSALEGELPEGMDVALLKGRSNYACLHKLEGGYPQDDDGALFAAPGEGNHPGGGQVSALGREVQRLRDWAQTTDTGDRDEVLPGVTDTAWRQISVTARECLGRSCPFVEECFGELAKARAADADVVITNHALLAINAFEDVQVLPEHDVVIIDEAHELRDRVTGAVTGALSAAAVRAAATSIRKHTSAKSDDLSAGADDLERALEGVPAELLARGLTDRMGASVVRIRDAARQALTDSKPEKGAGSADADADGGRQMARSRVTEILELCERMTEADDAREVLWLSRTGGWEPGRGYVPAEDTDPAVLNIAPLSVAGRLREGLFDGRTVVMTSATLSVGASFDAVAGDLGLQGPGAPRWEGVDVGSPFDYPRQGILYTARHLEKPGRQLAPAMLEETVDLIEASGGGALGLFSSRRAAEEAAEYVRERTEHPILCQGDASLNSLVKEFTEDPATCLFGTMSLWQGVDVPGDACRLVLIDRIPFPRPDDPLATARAKAIAEAGGNGFMGVSATHAAVRLAQGAGRLIRSASDKGVVAILDSRLATARYGGFLRSSLPPMWATQDRDVVLAALRRLNND
ncbi:ATP-dependent DNA helicase [Kocuria sp. JC486]|uniref:ATP-dependent helicase DinG n=1 Tax=Kocuria soli TaxID=2485125 RepID=A0A3N3ZNP8_9MICC|nr:MULTISPECIES: ATP-dependent DNA helicase [Kocuria]NHU85170.1 ATP-dependent DNA helicase [Kocuria sp. JC486]ROZ62496.1 ATP-dependent DNA helicase [Kocuria soli]